MPNSSATNLTYGSAEKSGRSPAFTLVELLVVIVVIAIVMTLLLLVGGHVLDNQKRSTTRNTMRLTEMAIDQFKTTDPLQDVYDNPKLRDASVSPPLAVGRLFGPYPPYQLAGDGSQAGSGLTTVRGVLEPNESLGSLQSNYTLNERLARDLGFSNDAQHINIPNPDAHQKRTPDEKLAYYSYDNRALYCYLAAFTPGVLNQIPDSAKKPLRQPPNAASTSRDTMELVDRSGGLPDNPSPEAFDVLGIYDAWGVPLDYFLQVKLEHKIGPDGINPQWVVTDRVPVLRSLGISKEEAVAEIGGTDELDPQKWIFSQPFPQPAFNRNGIDAVTGQISSTNGSDGGWVRVRAGAIFGDQITWDSYKYVPPEGQ
jgi:prepilin-type N-terminal cleavage/methylation domain-containing protein